MHSCTPEGETVSSQAPILSDLPCIHTSDVTIRLPAAFRHRGRLKKQAAFYTWQYFRYTKWPQAECELGLCAQLSVVRCNLNDLHSSTAHGDF